MEVADITQPGSEPLESVCRLQIRRGGSTYISTAFLVGDRILVTAGHNITSRGARRVRWARAWCGHHRGGAVWALPGQMRRSALFTDLVNNRRHYWGSRRRKNRADYGLVRLPSPLPYQSSFRLPRPTDPPLTRGDTVYVAGHPGGNEDPRLCMDYMHRASGVVLDTPAHMFTYAVATRGGNSGGPVWVVRDGERVVVGIHITGYRRTAHGASRRVGVARLIDDEVLRDLDTWSR